MITRLRQLAFCHDVNNNNNDMFIEVELCALFTAPVDFMEEVKMEIFAARASSVCTTFNITNDSIVEENESFEISFSVREDVILACNNSLVTIIDDDSE